MMGRPRLGDKKLVKRVINIRPEQAAALDKIADERGLAIGGVIRELLDKEQTILKRLFSGEGEE